MTALATFNRRQLEVKVLNSKPFQSLLELSPQMREAVDAFHSSKYSRCMELLESQRASLTLDVHMHGHVDKLITTIRNRGIVQYFVPFSSADLIKMAAAFNTTWVPCPVSASRCPSVPHRAPLHPRAGWTR